jgi:4-hydroxy-tetrahydrodipicolinate synthase
MEAGYRIRGDGHMYYSKHESKEACRSFFHGVWAAIPTPFNADLTIDEAGLRANVVRLVEDYGISGLYCGGGVGEFWALTMEEHRRLIEIVVDAARGRCGVIAQTGHHSVTDAITLTRQAEEAGSDFASVFTPYYPKASEAGIARYFREICEATDIGIWLVDTGLAGPKMSFELVAELAALPNICGIKLQHGAEHYRAVKRATKDSILLSDAHEASTLSRMRDGQQVFMSSPAPYLMQGPHDTPMVDYMTAAERGDWEKAEAISAALQPRRDLYERFLSAEHSRGTIAVPLIKSWASLLGLSAGPVRAPSVDMPDADVVTLKTDLARLFPRLIARAAA